MSKISDHLKTQPDRSMKKWAEELGVSRPYLYGLADGSRTPSLEVAMRIQSRTGGAVPITAWPSLAALIEAAREG